MTRDDEARHSRYRKVEVRTWGDEKFRSLSAIPPCGQGLWLFLITGPHTGPIPGLFRAGRMAMAEELGWELEAFDEAFGEAFRQGMVKADFRARVMFVPNAIRHNRPESPNVVRSWGKEFDLIPECDLKREALEHIREAVSSMGEGFAKAFVEAFGKAFDKPLPKASPKAMPNQEQEQEQEKEHCAPAGADAGFEERRDTATRLPDPPGFSEFWAAWPRTDRKQDRKKCVDRWRRAKLAPQTAAIVAHIEEQKRSKKWRDGFEPAPLTYLNGERWKDGVGSEDDDHHAAARGFV